MSSNINDGLGLEKLGDFDLSAMLDPAEPKFLEITVESILEDGENPRNSFDPVTLEEMADTMRARGVITPISVRPDPQQEGVYIVNHGHRRLRAAKLAGLTVIPAVIDDSFRDEDRIIENIQRDNLDMFDVAKFIARKLAEGLKQKDIAKLIGKSTAYISHHVQLLELPPHTNAAVQGGRVVDLTSIADLAKTEKNFPDSVELFLAGNNEVTRTAVRKFRDTLNEKSADRKSEETQSGELQDIVLGERKKNMEVPIPVPDLLEPKSEPLEKNTVVEKVASESGAGEYAGVWRQGKVIVELDGRRGVLMLERKPRNETYVWVEWEDGEKAESEVAVMRLMMKAVVAG